MVLADGGISSLKMRGQLGFGVLAFVLAAVLPNAKYSSNKSVDIHLNFFKKYFLCQIIKFK